MKEIRRDIKMKKISFTFLAAVLCMVGVCAAAEGKTKRKTPSAAPAPKQDPVKVINGFNFKVTGKEIDLNTNVFRVGQVNAIRYDNESKILSVFVRWDGEKDRVWVDINQLREPSQNTVRLEYLQAATRAATAGRPGSTERDAMTEDQINTRDGKIVPAQEAPPEPDSTGKDANAGRL